MTRLDIFLSQLDGLVVFLAAAHEEVFDLIHMQELTWFPMSQDPRIPATATAYKIAVSNAAFLLGYAYLESFLADVARQIYLRRPGMLPRERQLAYQEIVNAASKDELLLLMVTKEIRSVFGGSIEEVQRHFVQRLQIAWPDEPKIVVASKIRNCLMHNGAIVDERLAMTESSFSIGSNIQLDPGDVHSYGLAARSFASQLWADAYQRHLRETEQSGSA
jgi:hypothetical protein